jgi:prepilin-type N-terminal cleavage/methylation domain-containing protein
VSYPSKKGKGFTLFEVVVVLCLLGVMAAVATSKFSMVNSDAVADAELLKACIRVAQTRAMADVVSWSFQVSGSIGTFLRSGSSQSTVNFSTTGISSGTVVFDNRGTPSGNLLFSVVGSSGTIAVTVTSGTGFVP